MTWLAVLLAVFWLARAARDAWCAHTLPALPAWSPSRRSEPPDVTIVVPVRDGAAHIADSVRHLLAQTAVQLRLVVVDDRSDDATGRILTALAATDPRLTVVTVRELPPAWLGKSHALHVGAGQVRSQWILFADADVRLRPDVIARAIAAAEAAGADHVALMPRVRDASWLGQACLLAFQQFVLGRLGAVNAKPQRTFVGTGAFNLVRTASYRAIGGHLPLRLEVVDDVWLGALLFRAGRRSRVLLAAHDADVDWGPTPQRLVRDVEKNMFAVLRYRTPLAVAAIVASLSLVAATCTAPLWCGAFGWLPCAAFLSGGAAGAKLAQRMGWSPAAGWLTPFASLLLPLALGNSMVATLRAGGVRWRGTIYPLAELRRGQVR